MTKQERIDLRKLEIGSKLDRKLTKYSNNFNEIFNFFLAVHRKKLLIFCGVAVNIEFDVDGPEAKNTFRKYDNGQYSNGIPIISKHPNIVRAVIIGKKSWGLWVNNWTDGIVDWSFTKEEILEEFDNVGITIPESLMNDFNNRLEDKKNKRNQGYIKDKLFLRNKL